MDFIERIFGLSPDGGDGSTEALWLAALGAAVLAVGFRHRIIRWLAARNEAKRRD